MASIFMSHEDFSNAKEEQVEEQVYSWSEFPQGEVFKVLSLAFLTSRFKKECRLLTVANKKGDISKVWISKELATKLAQKEPQHIPFILSLGQEPRGAYKVNIYELSFKSDKAEYPILYENDPKEEEEKPHSEITAKRPYYTPPHLL